MLRPAHQLQPRHQGAGDVLLFHHLLLQHAVDTLADAQDTLVRLDMDVRSADLRRVLEDGLQQLHHRGVGHVLGLDQLRQVEVALGELLAELLGEVADFVGAAVDEIDGGEQVLLAHDGQVQRLLEHLAQLVVAEDVGGIGHAHQHAAIRPPVEDDGAVAAGEGLGDEPDGLGCEFEVLEIDERDVELPGEELQQLLLTDVAVLDEHLAELAAALLLFGERRVQLGFGNDLVVDEQVADANLLARDHRAPPGRRITGSMTGQCKSRARR